MPCIVLPNVKPFKENRGSVAQPPPKPRQYGELQTPCHVVIMRIPTTQQIRELEAGWIARCDDRWGQVLMEIAGRGAAIRALRMWQESPGNVAIVCGRGNNGGDGLVVARYLTLWGVPVSVWIVSQQKSESAKEERTAVKAGSAKTVSEEAGKKGTSRETAKSCDAGKGTSSDHDDAAGIAMNTHESTVNKNILETLDISVRELDCHEHFDDDFEDGIGSDPDVDEIFEDASLVVDALFGTGLTRPVEGVYRRVIDAMNRSGKRVLSIDVPSGINSDTGQVMGTAVRADQTVTFGYLKPGLLTHPGATLAGALAIVDIGLPEIPESLPDIHLMTIEIVREILPLRPTDAHKGSFGNVVAIAGSVGMGGAAMLACLSSLKVGAGLCYLATPRAVLANLPAEEVIYKPMPDTKDGTVSRDAYDELKKLLSSASAVILGPGLGLNDDTIELIKKLVNDIDCPCLIDADGLNALAKNPDCLPSDSTNFVLTPHPKELARLLECETADVQADRIGHALLAARKFNATIVLKGSMTVTANPYGEVFINPTGNPGMATAGAGDVLSGVIGGLLAQRVDPFQAAAAGVYIHGRAGDLLADEIDEAGIIAGDLKRVIPFAMQSVRDGDRSDFEATLLGGGDDE